MATSYGGGGFFVRFEEARVGEGRLGAEKCVVGGVFPSPGEYRYANVSDGANVRCRSEAPIIVRFG